MPRKTTKYAPKTIQHIHPVEVFMVSFVDGNQDSDTRLVMKAGNQIWFLHPDGVDGKLRRPAKWFKDVLMSKLGQDSLGVPEIPIPAGIDLSENPMA